MNKQDERGWTVFTGEDSPLYKNDISNLIYTNVLSNKYKFYHDINDI